MKKLFCGALAPLGVIEPEAEEYYDLFRPDAGLPPLIGLMEDGWQSQYVFYESMKYVK